MIVLERPLCKLVVGCALFRLLFCQTILVEPSNIKNSHHIGSFFKNWCVIYTQSSFFVSVFAGSVLFDDFSLDVVLSSESDFDVVRLPDGERLSVA